ncbi:MAG: redox-regulated ATPase YchF, partial [Chloroflexota bacterium]
MALSIGIDGLPNVGKSTLFNALTEEQNAEAANYPFCTIEPNKAIVAVPDERVTTIIDIMGQQNITYATIEFTDIAGLVEGASKGEGLGNKFLGNIRDVDAILHVVRCFDDPNVVHVSENPNPQMDIDTINTELALADLAQLEKRIERLERQIKGEPDLKPQLELAKELVEHVNEGLPLWTHPKKDSEAFKELNQNLRFLTAKQVIYAANVDEDSLAEDNEYVKQVRKIAEEQGALVLKLCAKLEAEIVGLDEDEQRDYLEMLGIEERGLAKVIRTCYETLGLISYFTFNDKRIDVWTVQDGWAAPKAAGIIHTDFEKGFIRAEVIAFEEFAKHRSRAAVKEAGQMRIEG